MSSSTVRSIVLATLAATGAATPPVLAQGQEAQTTQGSPGGKPFALEEVIVTAQKRGDEALSEVPISISVLGGDELDTRRFEGVAESLRQVAGVTAVASSLNGGTQISVRGVTAAQPLFGGSTTVGYYIDGLPWAFVRNAVVPDAGAYDIERVEVLRGPQGTLYGSSSLNGVVRILTKDADLNEVEFKGRALASSTARGGDNYRGDFAVGVPIVPGKLAARAIAGYNDLSGWVDTAAGRDVNSSRVKDFRLKINAQPIEALSVKFSSWLSRNNSEGYPVVGRSGISPVPRREPTSNEFDTYGLALDYSFPAFTLSSATNYIDYASDGVLDFGEGFTPGTRFNLTTVLTSKVFSEELRLASTLDGPWQWTVGGFWRRGDDRQFQNVEFIPAPSDANHGSKAAAAFGEITRTFLDQRLDATLGLRYFRDDVTVRENTPITGNPTQPLIRKKSTFSKVSPRAVLAWHPRQASTLYASYAQGFRSGFNLSPITLLFAPNLPAPRADTLSNFEVGAKGSVLDGRLAYDVAVYHIDWKDIQQTLGVPTPGTNPPRFVTAQVNGKSASGFGVDLGLTANLTANFQISLALGWNDLQMDEDVLNSGVVTFRKGDRPTDSGQTTGNLRGDYSLALGSSGYASRLSASVNYQGKIESRNFAGGILNIAESDRIVNASVGIALESPSHWVTTLYADNLTDEDGFIQADTDPAGFLNQQLRPRTVGVQFQYRY